MLTDCDTPRWGPRNETLPQRQKGFRAPSCFGGAPVKFPRPRCSRAPFRARGARAEGEEASGPRHFQRASPQAALGRVSAQTGAALPGPLRKSNGARPQAAAARSSSRPQGEAFVALGLSLGVEYQGRSTSVSNLSRRYSLLRDMQPRATVSRMQLATARSARVVVTRNMSCMVSQTLMEPVCSTTIRMPRNSSTSLVTCWWSSSEK
mmetsp:Transcript_60982/g.158248  ORF Transcript_60982/g.158248 Transcript_60982/m.158248 type:complete len:207 (+) Transcript_60982:105-725(+)